MSISALMSYVQASEHGKYVCTDLYILITFLHNSVAMDTLKNCSDSIKTACEKTLPAGLVDNIKKCNDLAEAYR